MPSTVDDHLLNADQARLNVHQSSPQYTNDPQRHAQAIVAALASLTAAVRVLKQDLERIQETLNTPDWRERR